MFYWLLFWREENASIVYSLLYSNPNQQSIVFVSSIQDVEYHWNVILFSYSCGFSCLTGWSAVSVLILHMTQSEADIS